MREVAIVPYLKHKMPYHLKLKAHMLKLKTKYCHIRKINHGLLPDHNNLEQKIQWSIYHHARSHILHPLLHEIAQLNLFIWEACENWPSIKAMEALPLQDNLPRLLSCKNLRVTSLPKESPTPRLLGPLPGNGCGSLHSSSHINPDDNGGKRERIYYEN